MKIKKTTLSGVLIIEPEVFNDKRGFFKETFKVEHYKNAGINLPFVQDNYSRSKEGVLRGLHFQKSQPQGKLVSCILGSVYDVAVDINPKSKNFGKYVGVELNDKNHLQLWIPPGYAHGFCVLSKCADIFYKCTDYYFPNDEGGLLWNDPEVAINWPIETPLISTKDKLLPTLKEIKKNQ